MTRSIEFPQGSEDERDKAYEALRAEVAELAISLAQGPLPLLEPEDVAPLVEERESRREKLVEDAIATGVYRNPNVPWDDGMIPYHCVCGRITYSDTPCDCENSHYDV